MILSFKFIAILLFLLRIDLTRACIKTSTYYRSQYRSQTHVFVPEEYRPMRPERSLEASGPLETQDFLASIPTTRLVRMDAPNVQFASEEARWMTKSTDSVRLPRSSAKLDVKGSISAGTRPVNEMVISAG
ncbi:hypothetical protein ACTXT7_014008 [Hymenolepis weldensis]